MTAEQYVNEVAKLLKCRTSKKREVKKQLLLDINTAVEHGRTLEEVLSEMGIPWDFANLYNDKFDKAEKRAAKREKRLRTALIVVIILAVLVGILYSKLPKWKDISESTVFTEEQVQSEAERIIGFYNDEDYDSIVACMNEEMREGLNGATLKYARQQLCEDFGDFESLGEMSVSEAVQEGMAYAMVRVSAAYHNIRVVYTITFDAEMRLAGFYVK